MRIVVWADGSLFVQFFSFAMITHSVPQRSEDFGIVQPFTEISTPFGYKLIQSQVSEHD